MHIPGENGGRRIKTWTKGLVRGLLFATSLLLAGGCSSTVHSVVVGVLPTTGGRLAVRRCDLTQYATFSIVVLFVGAGASSMRLENCRWTVLKPVEFKQPTSEDRL